MWKSLTAFIGDVALENFEDLSNVLVTLQVQEENRTFSYPFTRISMDVQGFGLEDSMFIVFSTQSEEIGQAQISLEPFQRDRSFEKSVVLTRSEPSQDKQQSKLWQQKKINAGKFRLRLEIKDKPIIDPSSEEELNYIKNAYSLLEDILGNVLKLDVPQEVDINNLGLALFEDSKGTKKWELSDLQHLLIVLKGLNEKLKLIPLLQAQLKDSEDKSRKYLGLYENMQELIGEVESNAEKMQKTAEEKYDSLLLQYKNILQELEKSKVLTNKLNLELDEFRARENEYEALKFRDRKLEDIESYYKDLVDSLQEQVRGLDESRKKSIEDSQASLKEAEELSRNYQEEINRILQENDELKNKMLLESSAKTELANEVEQQNTTISALESEILAANKELISYKALESQFHQSESLCASLEDQLQNVLIENSKNLCNFNYIKSQLSEEKENLLQHARELQQENMKLQTNSVKNCNDIGSIELEKDNLNIKIISLEQALAVKENIENLQENINQAKSLSNHLNETVYRELEFMAEYLLGQTEHNLSNIRVMNRLRNIVEDKETEILLLRDMVSDLQRKRAIYIPIKDDVIDSAVADYVNTRGTEVPLTREDHGIYIFGSKRVFVKLEHGRVISKI